MMVPYDYLMMSLPDLMMLVVVIITDFSHIWIKSCNPKRSSTRLVSHRAHIFTTYAIQIQVEKSILILTFVYFSFFSLKFSDVKRCLVDRLWLTYSSKILKPVEERIFHALVNHDSLNLSFRWKQMIWHQLLTISRCQLGELRKFSTYIHRWRISLQFLSIYFRI